MKILVGSVSHKDLIKETLLNLEKVKLTYEGNKGLNMVFTCDETDEKATYRIVKDSLKALPELGGLFFNVTIE